MNKVTAIEREIGVQAVLSFGSSSGGAAMTNFTITSNKYKSEAFMLCCDDTEKMRKSCEENGWTAVSIKNGLTSICGDDAVCTGKKA